MNEENLTPFNLTLFVFALKSTLKLRDDILLIDLVAEVLQELGASLVEVVIETILDNYKSHNLTEEDVDFYYYVADQYTKQQEDKVEKVSVDEIDVLNNHNEEYFKKAEQIIRKLDSKGLVLGEDYSFSNGQFLSDKSVYETLIS